MERTFPLILSAHYNQVVRPRGELLKDRTRNFSFEKAFMVDDATFCEHWGIEMSDLKEAKQKRHRPNDVERDYLWAYVHFDS
jgi:hypothetical protein|tara:strand:- start:15 stop:260 length:246 start_codon:yes stop_codon:yes gene_type:complete